MTMPLTQGGPALSAGPDRSQIPHGVQDRFLAAAARRRRAEAALRDCFVRWSYQEIIPPTFEYYDNLAVGASDRLQQAMYRFFDHKGRTLALRADFTPQVARIAATKLVDQPMPLRCFYMGSLFRYEEPQAGRKREFTQAGIELVGADTASADAEVVALAIAALDALGLRGFQINLGQMAFFRALTRDLPAQTLAPIREAIDHKNSARLAEALGRASLEGPHRDLLRRLPDLIGGPEVLDEAQALTRGLADSVEALAAIERLAQVYRLLRAYGVGDQVILDLSEVRGMDYYTGITFRGVVPGLGRPVISGGRYDDLIADFGNSLAAVGFGLGIERALLAQTDQDAPPLAPDVLVRGCDHPECLTLVGQLRQYGLYVQVDVLNNDDAGLTKLAQKQDIVRTLRCAGETWQLTDAVGERALTADELLREAETWQHESRRRS